MNHGQNILLIIWGQKVPLEVVVCFHEIVILFGSFEIEHGNFLKQNKNGRGKIIHPINGVLAHNGHLIHRSQHRK